jgi:hypothetical protein
MLRLVASLAIGLALSACAYGDAKLNLAYDASAAKPGLLSEAPAARVDLKAVDDARVEKQAIGYKRNGFGAKTADILSTTPPTEIVQDAIKAALEKNGHVIGGDNDRYAVKTTLNKFWFDYKTGLVSVEFFGSVQAEVSVVDKTTGQAIYTELFDGYHSEKTGGGLKKTWTRIMNAAIADLAAKMNLSPGLKDALETAAKAPASVGAVPNS